MLRMIFDLMFKLGGVVVYVIRVDKLIKSAYLKVLTEELLARFVQETQLFRKYCVVIRDNGQYFYLYVDIVDELVEGDFLAYHI